MKKTKTLSAILLALACTLSALPCNAQMPNAQLSPKQPGLPAGAIQEGTFADPQLVKNATSGVAGIVTVRGCERPDGMTPYVLTRPEGPEGYREWKERWVVSGCGKRYPVDIVFRETGPGKTANYQIQTSAAR